ncbi:hypothetical protein BXY75_2543 [Ulvibacter antarcticus]|uniref:Uncharacterized protein n=1 Tax=Ulvibacter antarcticus TaxID=442714 RepID=A0A3L9YIH6_9FLAO|nr:hypothetical protein BXY75_2543 [Ulvibacter antarcticus]
MIATKKVYLFTIKVFKNLKSTCYDKKNIPFSGSNVT